MNWTTVLAAFGAITGAAGLSWQVLNYRLTGGRVQVSSMYFKQDDLLQVLTDVINVGRLDVSITGYYVWADLSDQRFRKIRWKLTAARRVGISRTRRTIVTFPPSAYFHAPVEFGDETRSVELPAILRPGSALTLPRIGIGWPDNIKRRLRVAVALGTGRVIRTYPISMESFPSIQIFQDDSVGHIKVKHAKSPAPSNESIDADDD